VKGIGKFSGAGGRWCQKQYKSSTKTSVVLVIFCGMAILFNILFLLMYVKVADVSVCI
jgi:hypothetical protein